MKDTVLDRWLEEDAADAALGRLERADVRLGFIALTDCAPLVVAKERGFFRRHGLRVTLEKQASWANVRDKVAAGLLDGAQMLAPMPLAATLGLEGVKVPMTVPMALGLNGNAITVSRALYQRMAALDPEGMTRRPVSARPLREVLLEDRRAGRPKLRFAVVFPFSPHHYELRYWMAASGIDPARDVDVCVLPPASMVSCLADGSIHGFCVGDPYNQIAVEERVGCPLISKYEIWNNAPEKVLAVTSDWADRHPGTLAALVRAIVEAAVWLDRPENRLETAHVVAGESYVDAPSRIIADALAGRVHLGPEGGVVEIPDFHVFQRYAATFPWTSHAAWFLTQMLRWGQIEKPLRVRELAAAVFRPDLYREALEPLGLPAPEIDEKAEGFRRGPWTLRGTSGSIAMGPDLFFDGATFVPSDVVSYLEGFGVSSLRVRLDDLAERNA